jgi:hypothetical protein
VISQRRQAEINNLNFFTPDDSELSFPEQIADLTRRWSTTSPEGRQAILGFARLQALATAPPHAYRDATPALVASGRRA